ncbi:AraC family transcriptional regulator [Cohnella silvisoli]|uniref:AraC family transcriptional regulator n=1 Tax=Cohnella silvisoli TaxID=2873699 RepID=A0ABV1KWU9_9BACL|nr:AraC family transcriptional regulator [Cohnella silvisoli]MCD9023860.1 AraC family transcriptional regulator [Cohnella silvisoli]
MNSTPHTLEGRTLWDPNFPLYVTREREYFTLPIHIHDFVEIQYVAEGKGYHYIGDERIFVEKGDLFIIPIGTRHVYRPASEAAKDELIVYNCIFDVSVPEKLLLAYPFPEGTLTLLTGQSQAYRRYKDAFHEGRIGMEALHREYRMRQPGYESCLYALLTKLLVYLYRLELNLASALPANSQLGSALEYMEDNYSRPLTLAEIAKLLPASPSYMQRMFKQATGQSFTEYLQNIRMKKSTELLRHTTLTIKEIAEQVGYRDLKFFYALFRKKTGLSPRQYRNRAHGSTFAQADQLPR